MQESKDEERLEKIRDVLSFYLLNKKRIVANTEDDKISKEESDYALSLL